MVSAKRRDCLCLSILAYGTFQLSAASGGAGGGSCAYYLVGMVCRLSFCPAADNCLADTAYLLNFFGILAGSGCDFLLCVMLACSRDFFCVGLAANSTGCGFLPLIHASRSFCDSAHPCGMLRGKRLILCVLAFGAGKQLDAGCVCGAVRLPDDS